MLSDRQMGHACREGQGLTLSGKYVGVRGGLLHPIMAAQSR